MSSPGDFVPVARVVRSGFIESVHTGAVVVVGSDGKRIVELGNFDAKIYGRSSNKPLQAAAMLALGAELTDEQVALACASHSGLPRHLEVVRSVLADCGLSEDALRNTPGLPLDRDAADAVLAAGGGPASIYQNCSGKHAAMLSTCVANGWETATYLDPQHPVQAALTERIAQRTGAVVHVGVDGCGAPTHATTLIGLAAGVGGLAADRGRIWQAMSEHPDLVGGPKRPVTRLMQAVPGLIAKDGADGVFVGGLPDGCHLAIKIGDGGGRAAGVVMARALQLAGVLDDVDVTEFGEPVLGHGIPVGRIEPLF